MYWKLLNPLGSSSGILMGGNGARCGGVGGITPTAVEWVFDPEPEPEAGVSVYRLRVLVLVLDDLEGICVWEPEAVAVPEAEALP